MRAVQSNFRRHPLLVLATLSVLAAAHLGALASPPPRGASKSEAKGAESVLTWINGYRLEPTPKRIPDALKAMSRLGAFKDPETAGLYVGFLAGTIASAGVTADDLIARFYPFPAEDHWVIVRAIAYSDHADWQGLLHRFAERMPSRRVMIQMHLSGRLPTLKAIKLEQGPAPIDTLWGYYYATGSLEPLLRIISVLPWSKDTNNLERLTAGSMAKYTLAVNASRDMDLRRELAQALAHEPKATAVLLREVVVAAETMEVAGIRKQALGAIDQLKAKGPQSVRDGMFWGQAGQTALALGCVAAAALGQEYIGIPCVIGGALSTAALKMWAAGQTQ